MWLFIKGIASLLSLHPCFPFGPAWRITSRSFQARKRSLLLAAAMSCCTPTSKESKQQERLCSKTGRQETNRTLYTLRNRVNLFFSFQALISSQEINFKMKWWILSNDCMKHSQQSWFVQFFMRWGYFHLSFSKSVGVGYFPTCSQCYIVSSWETLFSMCWDGRSLSSCMVQLPWSADQ